MLEDNYLSIINKKGENNEAGGARSTGAEIFFWAKYSMYFGFFFCVDHMYCFRKFCP